MSEKAVSYAHVHVLSKYHDLIDTQRTCRRLVWQAVEAYKAALFALYPDNGTVVACDVPEYVGSRVKWRNGDDGEPEMELYRDGKPVSGFCASIEDGFFCNMEVVPPQPPLIDDEE